MIRNRVARLQCEHGQRPRDCRVCLREWAEKQAWQRAVDTEIERVRLLGFDAPDQHTCYLDLLADMGGDELPATWADLLEVER